MPMVASPAKRRIQEMLGNKFFRLHAIVALLLIASACQPTLESFGDRPQANTDDSTQNIQAAQILKTFCTDCHSGFHDE
jgi:hypothetical protein